MSKGIKEVAGVVQLTDKPMVKKYAIRPMDRVDSVVSAELHNDPPKDGEHIYTAQKVHIFHDANGDVKEFAPVKSISTGGRSATIGGWLRTSNKAEIEALDRYCEQFSGDFRKMYPIMVEAK